jgi:hypothetical protein
MTVAVFETTHFESAYVPVKLFLKAGHRVTLICPPETRSQMNVLLGAMAGDIEWLPLTNIWSAAKVLALLSTQKYDIIYLNSAERNFSFYRAVMALQRQATCIVTVHDINFLFANEKSGVSITNKQWLLNRTDAFTILTSSLTAELRTKITAEKFVYVVPGGIFCRPEIVVRSPELPVQIVVPGTIDERRRDYTIVLNLLAKAKDRGIRIHVTLLGNSDKRYSANVLPQLEDWARREKNLTMFEEIVPQEQYDLTFRNAHFALVPAKNDVLLNGMQERYGITKSSGAIGDIIRYGKLFFAHSSFTVDEPLKAGWISFNKVSDMVDSISQLFHADAYFRRTELLLQSLEGFSETGIIEKNASLFLRNHSQNFTG